MSTSSRRTRVFTIVTLCIIGIIVSLYAYYVEFSKENDANFTAACDISESISCSKVFTSRYGRGFGLIPKGHWLNQPNSLFGIAFYLIQLLLDQKQSTTVAVFQTFCAALANIGSVYLGYILLYVLEDFCVVCVSMYIINFLILLCNIWKLNEPVSAGKLRARKQQ